MNKFLGTLFILISLCSVVQSEQISKDIVLKAIAIFENEPLSHDGKGAASIVMKFADGSEDVIIILSGKIINWLGDDTKDTYYQYRVILLSAYIAGNVKYQLIQNVVQDDPYSGLIQVLRTYQQLQKRDPNFKLIEIERIKEIQSNNLLKEHIKKALSHTK
jgi:hypothetical protein